MLLLLHVNHFFCDSEFSTWIKCREDFYPRVFDFSISHACNDFMATLKNYWGTENQMAKFCRLNKERSVGSNGPHRNFLGDKETLKSYKGILSLRSMVR